LCGFTITEIRIHGGCVAFRPIDGRPSSGMKKHRNSVRRKKRHFITEDQDANRRGRGTGDLGESSVQRHPKSRNVGATGPQTDGGIEKGEITGLIKGKLLYRGKNWGRGDRHHFKIRGPGGERRKKQDFRLDAPIERRQGLQ